MSTTKELIAEARTNPLHRTATNDDLLRRLADALEVAQRDSERLAVILAAYVDSTAHLLPLASEATQAIAPFRPAIRRHRDAAMQAQQGGKP